MTLTNFRKHINTYSYTILSWIIGGLLFGFDQAIIIAFCGLAIDTALIIKNRVKIPKDIKRKDPFSTMLSVWVCTAFGFSFGYLLIIWLGTNQANDGVMDYWITLFQPLIDDISNYLPAIENYSHKLDRLGEKWRISRVIHLTGIIWTANIIFMGLLIGCVFQIHLRKAISAFYVAIGEKSTKGYYLRWLKRYIQGLILFGSTAGISAIFLYNSFYGLTVGRGRFHSQLEFIISLFIPVGIVTAFLAGMVLILLVGIHYNSHVKPITRLIRNKFLRNTISGKWPEPLQESIHTGI